MADDFLKVCNEHDVPFPDFEAQFCARCLNGECTRSNAGKSKFEKRVSQWEQQMFTDVPTMRQDDPRLTILQAKNFIAIDPGPAPEVGRSSAWLDPRELPAPVEPPVMSNPPALVEEPVPPAKVALPPEPAMVAPPEPVESPSAAPVEPSPPPAPEPGSNLLPQFLMNTPTQSGQMLGNHAPPARAPQKDPWAPNPPAKTDGVEVVKPGARIRFGGPTASDPAPKE